MSSSISRRTLRLLRSLVHPLLSIFLPLLFLLSADQLLRPLFPGISWFPRHLAPLLLAAGLEEAVMGNLLFKERAAFLARVRELVVLLALAFGILFILLGVRSGRGFHLSPLLIYPLTVTLLQWLLSHGIHSGLRERELLLSALAGKSGAVLRHCLRGSSYQAGLTVRILRNIRAGVVAFQIQVIALLVAAAVLKRQPALGGAFIVSLNALGGLLGMGVLRSFEEQQLLLGSGLALPRAVLRPARLRGDRLHLRGQGAGVLGEFLLGPGERGGVGLGPRAGRAHDLEARNGHARVLGRGLSAADRLPESGHGIRRSGEVERRLGGRRHADQQRIVPRLKLQIHDELIDPRAVHTGGASVTPDVQVRLGRCHLPAV